MLLVLATGVCIGYLIAMVQKNYCKHKVTRKKTPIRKAVRTQLWRSTFGNTLVGYCYCCTREVVYDEFHAGHIIAEANGGKISQNNLKVICAPCNMSCGTMNLEDFKKMINKQE